MIFNPKDGIILWFLISNYVFVKKVSINEKTLETGPVFWWIPNCILAFWIEEIENIEEISYIETLSASLASGPDIEEEEIIHWNLSKSAGWTMKMLKWIDATF